MTSMDAQGEFRLFLLVGWTDRRLSDLGSTDADILLIRKRTAALPREGKKRQLVTLLKKIVLHTLYAVTLV
jgi:hypothetical protein